MKKLLVSLFALVVSTAACTVDQTGLVVDQSPRARHFTVRVVSTQPLPGCDHVQSSADFVGPGHHLFDYVEGPLGVDFIVPDDQSQDLVLVAGQVQQKDNGIYRFSENHLGAWGLYRVEDYDQNSEIHHGDVVDVTEGSQFHGTTWRLATPEHQIDVDVKPLVFEQEQLRVQ